MSFLARSAAVALGLSVLVGFTPSEAAAPAKPNIIFILADDFSMNLIGDAVLRESMPHV